MQVWKNVSLLWERRYGEHEDGSMWKTEEKRGICWSSSLIYLRNFLCWTHICLWHFSLWAISYLVLKWLVCLQAYFQKCSYGWNMIARTTRWVQDRKRNSKIKGKRREAFGEVNLWREAIQDQSRMVFWYASYLSLNLSFYFFLLVLFFLACFPSLHLIISFMHYLLFTAIWRHFMKRRQNSVNFGDRIRSDCSV